MINADLNIFYFLDANLQSYLSYVKKKIYDLTCCDNNLLLSTQKNSIPPTASAIRGMLLSKKLLPSQYTF